VDVALLCWQQASPALGQHHSGAHSWMSCCQCASVEAAVFKFLILCEQSTQLSFCIWEWFSTALVCISTRQRLRASLRANLDTVHTDCCGCAAAYSDTRVSVVAALQCSSMRQDPCLGTVCTSTCWTSRACCGLGGGRWLPATSSTCLCLVAELESTPVFDTYKAMCEGSLQVAVYSSGLTALAVRGVRCLCAWYDTVALTLCCRAR
jgi:hypothetical protein